MERITLTHKFAIYVDFTGEDSPRPFYVGKGTEWRVNDRRSRNAIYRSIREKYGGMQRTIVFETDDETIAYDKEVEFIALYRTYTRGGDNWWGANGDMGGRGGPSTPKSLEHREKIRQALQGRKCTPEHRIAMSIGGKGKHLSVEHRAKIGASGRETYVNNPELRAARQRGAIKANQIRWATFRTIQEAAATAVSTEADVTSDVNK